MWDGRYVNTMYQITMAHTYLTIFYQLYLNKAELKKKEIWVIPNNLFQFILLSLILLFNIFDWKWQN